MGRKGRRDRSDSHVDEASPKEPDPPAVETTPTRKDDLKDSDFAQRRELQRQQAAAKRRSKQKCYLCGKAGHMRRQCPGIADDGRGMSRYKGKSDPKKEKQKYLARRQGRSGSGTSEASSESLVASLEYPEDFDTDSPYVDVHCDIPATIDYLRSGRGKSKISQKEAIEEYQAAMQIAKDRSQLKAVISKSFLKQPNRPWINPVAFEIDNVDIFFALGLSEACKVEMAVDQETATQCLVSTIQENHEVIATFVWLDYTSEKLGQPGMDACSQVGRLHCCWEAAGRAQVPLQVQVSPGASTLDPEVNSVAGTDYAKVLLELQSNLTTAVTKYPKLQIHLVGWSGRSQHMMALLQAFPNNLAAIGLDGAVTFAKATHLHECAFEVSLDRLVLETSNVIPSNVAIAMGRAAFSQSGWWPFVAESIIKHKKVVSMDQVVSAVYENTRKLYPQVGSIAVQENMDPAAEDEVEDEEAVRTFFVYGTLRDTGSNRHVVFDFIETCTKNCYIIGSMFHYSPEGGSGRFPYAIEDGDNRVFGELLTVTDWDTALERLDALERYPSFYYRKVHTVYSAEGDERKTVKAWVYFMQPSQECRGNPVRDGDWIKDTQDGEE